MIDMAKRWTIRSIRWVLLLLGSVLLFVLIADRFYPIALSPMGDLSRAVTAAEGEEGGWLYATTNRTQKWRFRANPSRIDPLYLSMLRVVEDQRFDRHPGIDPLAMTRALGQWIVSGHIRSGGSTLTMQLARLLEPKPRTLRSKIIEMIRALQLELHHTKAELLTAYLTLTPFGGNVEGIVAASWRYFGKLPTSLSPAQAALLVALPRSPERLRPDRHPEAAHTARDRVLRKALTHGLLTPALYREALREPLPRTLHPFPRYAPHLAQHLLHRFPRQSMIPTTLERPLQIQLESWAKLKGESLPKGATFALLLVRNRDSAVLAWLGSHAMFSPRTAGYIDMLRIPRSPGSTLKPFVYGMAFEQHRLHPNTRITDRQTRFGDYLPHNYSRTYTGEVTVAYALAHSLNIPAVKVLHAVGAPSFVARLGSVTGKLQLSGREATLPVILGGLGIRPVQLAQLYVALANGGAARPIHTQPVASEPPASRRLLSPEAARMVTAILRQIPPPEGHIDPHDQIAFKTGTSYGYRDLWTAAYTREYTAIIWIGRPDNAPLPRSSGLERAAPLAFDAFDLTRALLPGRGWSQEPSAIGLTPPEGLRYYDRNAHEERTPLSFVRPAPHARFRSAGCHDVTVEAVVTDGKPPYIWYLDGLHKKVHTPRTTFRLQEGAHTLTVIDQAGATITRDIWVDRAECEEGGGR